MALPHRKIRICPRNLHIFPKWLFVDKMALRELSNVWSNVKTRNRNKKIGPKQIVQIFVDHPVYQKICSNKYCIFSLTTWSYCAVGVSSYRGENCEIDCACWCQQYCSWGSSRCLLRGNI